MSKMLDGIHAHNDMVNVSDHSGNKGTFKLLDVIDIDGREFLVMLPMGVPNAGEVLILELVVRDGEETFADVMDMGILQRAFTEFKYRNEAKFNFTDTDA